MSNAAREIIENGDDENSIASASECSGLIAACVTIAQNGAGNFTAAEKETLGANFDAILAYATACKNSLMIVED